MRSLSTLKRQKPSIDLNDYRFTFYGQPGSGKTTTAFYFFDDPLFLAWEKGQKTLPALIWECYTWKDLLQFIKEARLMKRNGEEFPTKVIVVDTVDIMRDKGEVFTCNENNWSSPSDGEWGAGFAEVRREFESKIDELEELGFKVNFIAHDKMQSVERKDGEKYDKTTLQLGSTATNAVVKKVDIVMYFDFLYEKDEDGNSVKKRIIRFHGGDKYEAKCRIPGFPEIVYAKDTPEETAEMLRELFKEHLEKMSSEQFEKFKEESKKGSEEIPKKVDLSKVVTKAQIDEITEKAMNLVKEKKVTVEDITNLIKENTSVEQMSEIRNVDEYEKLKEAIKNL